MFFSWFVNFYDDELCGLNPFDQHCILKGASWPVVALDE